MLRSYLKVALRHVRREAGYSVIHVLGLAIGMVCCLLIMLFVREELSYDRFHEDGDRIVRLIRETSAMTAAPMGPGLVADLPEVAAAVRLVKLNDVIVDRGDEVVFREDLLAADPQFFDMFTFELLRGDPATALERPDALVLSESAAEKYFGAEDPVGRSLTLRDEEERTFTVTGVMRDAPAASHFDVHVLASFRLVESFSNRIENWRTNWLYTYLLLADRDAAEGLEAALPAFFENRTGEAWSSFRVQRLHDIHLHSAGIGYDIAPQGDIRQVVLFSLIAGLVLVIACINFVNLSTARAMGRAREVGVRKVVGAQRRQLIGQFLGESLLTTLLAVLGTAVLAYAVLPVFGDLVGSEMNVDRSDAPFILGAVAALIAAVGLLAGSYPALVLSSFRPARILRPGSGGGSAHGSLRRGLVVLQFAISIFLIAGTAKIYQQLEFVRNARLGLEPERTVVLPIGDALQGRPDVVRREIVSVPGVQAASAAGTVPAGTVSDFMYRPEGWTAGDLPGWDTFFIDEHYVDVLDMEIVRGRDFDESVASDSAAFLLNESAWNAIRSELGASWANPIGKQLELFTPGATGWDVFKTGRVIGIVKDFHYQSMRASIAPLVLTRFAEAHDVVLAKVRAGEYTATLAALESAWRDLVGDEPFNYYFLDASFDALYRTERRMGRLAGAFGGLALFVACLGLFGLATFMAERRRKEIGIRKVLGASSAGIVGLLSIDFVKLVGAGFVLAAPVAYLAIEEWLSAFAYRVDIGAGVFLLAGLVALICAVTAVSYQALRAAGANPVRSLRYE